MRWRVIVFRKPKVEDGYSIYKLVKNSKPLDLNSTYNYILLCDHFKDTCVVFVEDSEIVGFVSGYIIPNKVDTLFIWQVAVSSKMRGKGIAKSMLKEILNREELKNIKYIHTTITPSNKSSQGLFKSFAKDMNTNCEISDYFSKELFGKDHEEERLFRIGPIK